MRGVGALVLLAVAGLAGADTPAHCLYEDIKGTWTLAETERSGSPSLDCDVPGPTVYVTNVTLTYPNTAIDHLGNEGTWTLIYNQGFEININERSYFAFSYYEGTWDAVTSYCDGTFPGWSRDTTVRNWSCFTANKTTPVPPRTKTTRTGPHHQQRLSQQYHNDHQMIAKINAAQTSWTAKAYPQHEKYTAGEMQRRGGSVHTTPLPPPAPATRDHRARVALLPEAFDWRNVSGVSYVSPVRDQADCGSCYAFASMANLESQVRIVTKNQRQDVFSTEDPVACSVLAQGCMGGFDYLIAGRYAMDQGVVAEQCNPYVGQDSVCVTDSSCARTYVSEYTHVGGYYGACNEETMLQDLVTYGPISVSYMVYNDFYNYESGIYHYTGVKSEFNPFEITNHVVLIVGYGADEATGEKFWTVKNSWGADWGEDGFFRIRRGTDECSMESMAVRVTIIP